MKLLLTAYLHTSTAVAAAGDGEGDGAEDGAGSEVEDAASRLQVEVAALAKSACETLLGHNWLLNARSCPRSFPPSPSLSFSHSFSLSMSLLFYFCSHSSPLTSSLLG